MSKLSIFEMVMICIRWFVRQIDQLNDDLMNCKLSGKGWKECSDTFEQQNAEYKRMIYAIEQEMEVLQSTNYATYIELRKIINKD